MRLQIFFVHKKFLISIFKWKCFRNSEETANLLCKWDSSFALNWVSEHFGTPPHTFSSVHWNVQYCLWIRLLFRVTECIEVSFIAATNTCNVQQAVLMFAEIIFDLSLIHSARAGPLKEQISEENLNKSNIRSMIWNVICLLPIISAPLCFNILFRVYLL